LIKHLSRSHLVKNILIIEDSVDSAEMLSMLLQFEGHSVICAHSGRAGLLLASQSNPDVIIIDLGLPDMDGLKVVRELSSVVQTTNCTFVTFTGQDGVEIRRQAHEAGAHHFFVKGGEISDLLSIISNKTR
jgi:DNA-binding response OmpR family regulator